MPALTHNPDAGGFLLAFSADDGAGGPPQVYLQQIGAQGTIGSRVLVAPSTITQTHPALAYGGVGSNRALVLWREGQGANSRVHAQLVDGQEQPVGMPFLLAQQDGGDFQRDAAVAADPGAQRFLIVWEGKKQSKERIFLQTVDYNGHVDASAPVEVSAAGPGIQVGHPDIAGREGLYVVVWERSAQGDHDIYLRRVRPTKEMVGPEETMLVDPTDQYLPAVTVAGPDEALVAWQEGKNGDVVGRRLRRSDAQIVRGRLDVSRAETAQLRPAVAGDPVRRRYLSVWTDGRNVEISGLAIYGQLVRGSRSKSPRSTRPPCHR